MIKKSFFRVVLVVILQYLSITSDIYCQNDTLKYTVETKFHYGFVLSHHKKIEHLSTAHFPGFEINIGKQTDGKEKWQFLYKYPVTGLAFWYANMRNHNVLGSALALYPYLNFHLVQKHYFLLNYRFGIGLGYLTKKFDRLENYKNIAIGTHVNTVISMFYECKWKILKSFFVSCSIGMTHFSNGAVKFPNLGLNIPTISAGIAYIAPLKEPATYNKTGNKQNEDKSNIEIISILSGGIKEIYPVCGDKYGAFTFTTSFLKPLSIKRKLDAGFDLFWDFSNLRTLKRKEIEVKNSYEVIRTGIHFGHQLDFSRLLFSTQLGFYLYAKDKSDGPVYMRVALRYKINKKIFFNLSLKTHYAKADFTEWGVGYFIK